MLTQCTCWKKREKLCFLTWQLDTNLLYYYCNQPTETQCFLLFPSCYLLLFPALSLGIRSIDTVSSQAKNNQKSLSFYLTNNLKTNLFWKCKHLIDHGWFSIIEKRPEEAESYCKYCIVTNYWCWWYVWVIVRLNISVRNVLYVLNLILGDISHHENDEIWILGT